MKPEPDPNPTFALIRADGVEDQLTRRRFNSYDEAYDVLESYYGDFCCSDDERIDYNITSSD